MPPAYGLGSFVYGLVARTRDERRRQLIDKYCYFFYPHDGDPREWEQRLPIPVSELQRMPLSELKRLVKRLGQGKEFGGQFRVER